MYSGQRLSGHPSWVPIRPEGWSPTLGTSSQTGAIHNSVSPIVLKCCCGLLPASRLCDADATIAAIAKIPPGNGAVFTIQRVTPSEAGFKRTHYYQFRSCKIVVVCFSPKLANRS
jgi:hypothetical protein